MDPGMELLTTLGEVGGITGMMLAVAMFVARMMKRNGCTMKCYNCSGQPLAEVDIEEAATTSDHKQTQTRTRTPSPECTPTPEPPRAARAPVRPSDIQID